MEQHGTASPPPASTPGAGIRKIFARAVQCHQQHALSEAERLYRQVLSHAPRHAETLLLLGMVAIESRRYEQALELIDQVLALQPDNADAHRNRGIALTGLGRTDEAAQAYRRALAVRPDHVAANNLGVLLQQQKDPVSALAAYRLAEAANANCAEVHNNLATALKETGCFDEAIAACRRAIALKPDYAEAYANLAVTFQEFGQAAQARAAVDTALTIDPAYAYAWYIRSDLKKFSAGDPDIAAMQSLLARADAEHSGLDERIYLAFALGKAWMDAAVPDRAFACLQAGNRLKRGSFVYRVEDDVARIAAFAQNFPAELMARLAGAGEPSDLPVFILGMPRSGTTLVEQILASHPAVSGGGELPALKKTIERHMGAEGAIWPDDEPFRQCLSRMGRDYLGQVSPLAHGRRHVVDKGMGNFRFAGLIHLMLPNARLIHCRRDPIDTCFSCYTKNFTGDLPFSYDLRELGVYYRAYARLMAHWREVLPPSRFIEVDYEDLVADLEGQAGRLVAFCGLDWDAACLSFHRTRRQVTTASVNQVRQPLYRSSVGRWKPYARPLAPLLAELAPA